MPNIMPRRGGNTLLECPLYSIDSISWRRLRQYNRKMSPHAFPEPYFASLFTEVFKGNHTSGGANVFYTLGQHLPNGRKRS